jgi:PilZ domain
VRSPFCRAFVAPAFGRALWNRAHARLNTGATRAMWIGLGRALKNYLIYFSGNSFIFAFDVSCFPHNSGRGSSRGIRSFQGEGRAHPNREKKPTSQPEIGTTVQMRESSGSAAERRQTPRTKLVEIAYIGMGPENGGLVLDVSDGGLSFHAVAPVKPAETIRFLLSLRGHSRIEGAGKVVWTNDLRTVCGLRFTSLSSGAREHLNSWTNQSRMPAAPRQSPLSPLPPMRLSAPLPVPPRRQETFSSAANQSDAVARPVFAIPPASEVYLSEPAGRSLWGGQLFLWMIFAVLGGMVLGSAYLFGLHVGRSQASSTAQFATHAELQAGATEAESANGPAPSTASERPSAANNAAPVASERTSVSNGAPAASTVATSIPGATAAVPGAALMNASKTDTVPANSFQRSGDDERSNGADQRAEQALQAGKSELAAAMAALHGTNGVPDSSKAARLLWAAVANHNSTAEVVLADLYLRGEGVTQSCKQGQVLLLAASKSGDIQASEKLAELYRNGCP